MERKYIKYCKMSITKNVLIGIPVKNCGAWLETTIWEIINLDYHKENISIVFIENDKIFIS